VLYFLCAYSIPSENDFLHVISVGVNSCLLSAFGVVLVAATLYDVMTTVSLRRKSHHNADLHSTMADDGADDHNSLINDPQPSVIDQAEDVPLILVTPEFDSNSRRACGKLKHKIYS